MTRGSRLNQDETVAVHPTVTDIIPVTLDLRFRPCSEMFTRSSCDYTSDELRCTGAYESTNI